MRSKSATKPGKLLAGHTAVITGGFGDAGLSVRIYDANPGLREKAREFVPDGTLIKASEVADPIAVLCDPANRPMVVSVRLMGGGPSLRRIGR